MTEELVFSAPGDEKDVVVEIEDDVAEQLPDDHDEREQWILDATRIYLTQVGFDDESYEEVFHNAIREKVEIVND